MKYLKIHLFTLSPFSLLQMLLQITSSKSVKTIRKAHRRSVLPLPTIPPPAPHKHLSHPDTRTKFMPMYKDSKEMSRIRIQSPKSTRRTPKRSAHKTQTAARKRENCGKSIFLRAQFPAKGGMCTIYVFCAFFGGCTRTHTSSRTPCHALVQRIVTQFWPTKKKKKKIKIKETKEKVVSVRWPKKFHAVFEVQKCSIILG